jgi:hypothetical protein
MPMLFSDVRKIVDNIPALSGPVQGEWLYNMVLNLPDNARICEVGTYLGYITTILALACLDTSKRVFAVDSMFGFHTGSMEEIKCFYLDFWNRLVSLGLSDYVIPFPMKSYAKKFPRVVKKKEFMASFVDNTDFEAYEMLLFSNIKFDLIYFDGNHNEDNVLGELKRYTKVLNVGGIICGDDFNSNCDFGKAWKTFDKVNHPVGVGTAVYSFFKSNSKYRIVNEAPANQYAFRKVG